MQNAPQREGAVEAAVARYEGDFAIASRNPVRPPCIVEIEQHPGLSVSGKTGETNDFAPECLKRLDVAGALGKGQNGRAARVGLCNAARSLFALDAAHGFDEAAIGEIARSAVGDHLSVLHHHDAVGG